jgi:exosortase/archaeosortase family protein
MTNSVPQETTDTMTLTRTTLGGIALLAPWLLLLFQLSITWETNEQYTHGYIVPILCLYMLVKADISKIAPASVTSAASPFAGKAFMILGVPLMLVFVPLWIVRGANSDWRLLNLALFAVVFVFTLAQWYDRGGWNRIKPMLFPLLFFIVAIPWPLATDLKLTQWFQERISSLIVDILLLLEHEARLEGTVIDIGVFGQIGVDQACSGIHGLQASLVITLFLGAYYRFLPFNRVVYLLAGTMIALMLNLLRAFCLSYVKVKGKGEWLDQPLFSFWEWDAPNLHDLAGFIETGMIFLLIVILGQMAKGRGFRRSLSDESTSWSNLQSSPPIWLSITSILIVVGSAIGSEWHYRNTEAAMESLPNLSLSLDDPEILTERKLISRQVKAQLHYEDAQSIQWQDRFRLRPGPYGLDMTIDPSTEYWQAFECNWESGGACTAVLSTHTPESCLPLTGLVQISPSRGDSPTMVPVRIGDRDVLFETYEFARGSRKLFVFRCFWPSKLLPGKTNVFPSGGYDFNGRINAALEGRRNVGGTMLAIAVANVSSKSIAIEKLVSHAQDKIKLEY